jgi:hypothetical protein
LITRLPACGLPLLTLLVPISAAGEDKDSAADHHVEILAGLGYTFTEDSSQNGSGEGGFLEGEYVFRPHRALSPRLYAGLLMTFPDNESCGTPSHCDVQSKIVFLGAKVRARVPIPWVSPYAEFGLGASAGYLRTLDGLTVDETMRGVAIHLPVAIGLALGRRHEFDVGFNYIFHPAQQQVGGALAFGVAFAVP